MNRVCSPWWHRVSPLALFMPPSGQMRRLRTPTCRSFAWAPRPPPVANPTSATSTVWWRTSSESLGVAHAPEFHTVVIRSTVPPGTVEDVTAILQRRLFGFRARRRRRDVPRVSSRRYGNRRLLRASRSRSSVPRTCEQSIRSRASSRFLMLRFGLSTRAPPSPSSTPATPSTPPRSPSPTNSDGSSVGLVSTAGKSWVSSVRTRPSTSHPVPTTRLRLRRIVPSEGPSLPPLSGPHREHRHPIALGHPGEQPAVDR